MKFATICLKVVACEASYGREEMCMRMKKNFIITESRMAGSCCEASHGRGNVYAYEKNVIITENRMAVYVDIIKRRSIEHCNLSAENC
ncbi:hypothetical protein CEXT_395811 [Caerostris extrusa]|uniref:Uncharacterized protein n=1 Tax=Caerostris extrusa TaxID=172846 RepID=A0AAV4X9H6_CAEEX|nr:hypothetical protein CEXT_395811 [Caerostris extrusa]